MWPWSRSYNDHEEDDGNEFGRDLCKCSVVAFAARHSNETANLGVQARVSELLKFVPFCTANSCGNDELGVLLSFCF